MEAPCLVTGIKDKFISVRTLLTNFMNRLLNLLILKRVQCSSTYTVAYSDDNVITLWGTRSGIPNKVDFLKKPSDASFSKNSKSSKVNFELGNSTTAFTNFLTSVYKSELILEPIDILA